MEIGCADARGSRSTSGVVRAELPLQLCRVPRQKAARREPWRNIHDRPARDRGFRPTSARGMAGVGATDGATRNQGDRRGVLGAGAREVVLRPRLTWTPAGDHPQDQREGAGDLLSFARRSLGNGRCASSRGLPWLFRFLWPHPMSQRPGAFPGCGKTTDVYPDLPDCL